MTRYRVQELLKELNNIIVDEDLEMFPELKIAIKAIEKKHKSELGKYRAFVGAKYKILYLGVAGQKQKGIGRISEISHFWDGEVIVKLEIDDPSYFEYCKLSDLISADTIDLTINTNKK